MPNPLFPSYRTPKPREFDDLLKRLSELRALQETAIPKALRAFGSAAHGSTSGTTPQPGGIPDRLVLRHGFSYADEPAPSGTSDRAAPARKFRPPATRISNSRGIALRLELIALGLAQSLARPGRTVANPLPLRPPSGQEVGWVDLVASTSPDKGDGRFYALGNDKKLRHVESALATLAEASLVSLLSRSARRRSFEGFALLEETGPRAHGEPVTYRVPTKAEEGATFTLPMSFITNGWVHVLRDSEIALLLMTACGRGRLPDEERVAVPAEVRLRHYGISRDSFGAHRLLSDLGLLSVAGDERDERGRASGYAENGPSLHRLGLVEDTFALDAVEHMIATLRRLLGRGPWTPASRAQVIVP